MKQCKVFIPYGALGGGVEEEAFERGLAMKPDILSCDAGSTDSGPYYLGTGKGKYSNRSLKEDLKRMVLGARRINVPVTIGSCGTCGSDQGVDMMSDLLRDICKEEGLSLKVARIYTQQDSRKMRERYLSIYKHDSGLQKACA